MVKLVSFDTEERLMELTGLSEYELWKKDFSQDGWYIKFQSEIKLHTDPT